MLKFISLAIIYRGASKLNLALTFYYNVYIQCGNLKESSMWDNTENNFWNTFSTINCIVI